MAHLSDRQHLLSCGIVTPDGIRCVQCGICSFNCPQGIDVRHYAWLNQPIVDAGCLCCGECIQRCPRGVLFFKRFDEADSQP